MRVLALAVALLAVACSSSKPPETPPTADRQGRAFTIATRGDPFALRFEGTGLRFCDGRGGRQIDLKSGIDTAAEGACPDPTEPNSACSGLSLDVVVRAPLAEPNDIVDVDGWSVPLKGRVHDCAASGKLLGIVTGNAVVVVDVGTETTKQLSPEGGDRVTIAPPWIAWSNGAALRVASTDGS